MVKQAAAAQGKRPPNAAMPPTMKKKGISKDPSPTSPLDLLPEKERQYSALLTSTAWRHGIVVMLELALLTVSELAQKLGTKKRVVVKWANKFWQTGEVNDAPRTGAPVLIQDKDAERVKAELGQAKPGIGLETITARLIKGGGIANHHVESYRRALIRSGWSVQPVVKALFLEDIHQEKRWHFASKYRDLRLSNKMIWTDSKVFYGGEVEPQMRKGGMASWAPNGEPRSVLVDKHAPFKLHVYAGICKYGVTKLTYVTGTTGLNADGAYTCNKRVPKAQQAAMGGTTKQTNATGVGNVEYLDILKGGGPRGYIGILNEAKSLFSKTSFANCWWFQQDGARAHTIAATSMGKGTKAAIKSVAPNLLDDWPPNSPDLSPIENLWRQVEWHLWTHEAWEFNSQAAFRDALDRSWDAVTQGDQGREYIKKLVSSFDRRPGGRLHQVVDREGGQTDY